MPLDGRLLEPGERLSVTLRNAFPAQVEIGKIVLSKGVATLGSLAIPFGGRYLILGNPKGVIAHEAQIDHGTGFAVIGRKCEILQSLGIVLPNAQALEIQDSKVRVRSGMALLRGGPQPVQSRTIILRGSPPIQIENRKIDLG